MQEKLPNYTVIYVHGPFHRKWSPTQTDQDLEQILVSGELWGRPGFGSDMPAVKAYASPLPAGEPGFEFYARAVPDSDAGPRAQWHRREDGSVRQNGDVAKMSVMITRIRRKG